MRMERVYQQPGLNPRADIDVFVCWCVIWGKEIERSRSTRVPGGSVNEYHELALV